MKCTRGSTVQTFLHDTRVRALVWAEWRVDGASTLQGFGTSSAKEAKEYFSNLDKNRLHFEVMRTEAGHMIDMCFNKNVSDRKQWIANYEQGTHMDFSVQEMPYADFVNKEYIVMAVQSNLRGIPHVMDGLKPSTRKILFACLKRGLRQEIKVAQLAGYTSEHAAYHHGESFSQWCHCWHGARLCRCE